MVPTTPEDTPMPYLSPPALTAPEQRALWL